MILNFDELLDNEQVQMVISPLFDPNLNRLLSSSKKDETIKVIEQAIGNFDIYTSLTVGLPIVDITDKEDASSNHIATFHHKNVYGRNEIQFNTAHCKTGLDFLCSYIHEKRHQFQLLSVLNGNKDMTANNLLIWRNAFCYTPSSMEESDYYSAVEVDAYSTQLGALIKLKKLFENGNLTKYRSLSESEKKDITNIIEHNLANTTAVVTKQMENKDKLEQFNKNAMLYYANQMKR